MSGQRALEQANLPSGIDRFRAAVDPELAIDVFDVGADRVGGDREMVGDLAAGEVGIEQTQHLEFALAELLDQGDRPGINRPSTLDRLQ